MLGGRRASSESCCQTVFAEKLTPAGRRAPAELALSKGTAAAGETRDYLGETEAGAAEELSTATAAGSVAGTIFTVCRMESRRDST